MHPTITRLAEAMNRHDVSAMTALFAPDYRSEQPAQPNRGFGGADQVGESMSNVFTGVPGLQVGRLGVTTDVGTAWSEWSWLGMRNGGARSDVRGVVLFDIGEDERISAARLSREPM